MTQYRPALTDAVPPASFRLIEGGKAGAQRLQWAVSSAVEHYVDIVVATGSIPVPPTIRRRTTVRHCVFLAQTRREEGEER